MGIGSGTAMLIGGLAGAGGSIASGIMGSNAASDAASQQAAAAERAAQLQYQASQNALGFQEGAYGQGQANLAPWLNSGAGSLANLDYLLGISPPTTQGPLAGQAGAFTGTPGSNQPSPYSGGNWFNSGQFGQGTPLPGSTGQTGASAPPWHGMPQPGAVTTQPGMAQVPAPVGGVPSTGPMVGSGPAAQSFNQPQPGTTNLGSMVNPNLGGFGSLMEKNPYSTFTAPTDITEQNDPGYQARLKLGTQAIDQSAAARGNVLTGGTMRALDQFGQDYASNEYNNVYNRAFNTNASNYNSWNQNAANQYNRLASLAGVGQQTAGQLGYLGENASQGISNNLLSTAANMGQQYNNAAAANASGIIGSANAWSGGLSGATNNISNLMMMQSMFGGGGGAGGYGGASGGYGGINTDPTSLLGGY